MTQQQLLALLLALSAALHLGCAAAFVAWREGTTPGTALLIGGSTVGAAASLYLTAVGAYH
ncbi:hypothetical protein OG892_22030 [Streptomyces sp. NBC_00341]|uniref:hypothetical protein n=1 Tax=unclassified Streptomyces TaxID=2593676 RepID=UPI00308C5A26|nr:hypothetical protein OG892_22030 [Streptomyces sp. NBC_00341]